MRSPRKLREAERTQGCIISTNDKEIWELRGCN